MVTYFIAGSKVYRCRVHRKTTSAHALILASTLRLILGKQHNRLQRPTSSLPNPGHRKQA